MKRDFEVIIKRTETCSVVVAANDEDQAKALALDMEERGMIDAHYYSDAAIEVHPSA